MSTNQPITPEPMLSTEELAAYLKVPEKTLAQWAYLNKGPRYAKVGRYRRYRMSDVQAWLESKMQGDA